MIRATKVIRAGHWSGVATDAVLLGYDDRHRRRFAMQGEHVRRTNGHQPNWAPMA